MILKNIINKFKKKNECVSSESASVGDKIYDMGFEDVIIFSSPDYTSAFLGVTSTNVAVYDYDLMIDYLVDNDICETYDEAADFICFNDSFHENGYPLILYRYGGE